MNITDGKRKSASEEIRLTGSYPGKRRTSFSSSVATAAGAAPPTLGRPDRNFGMIVAYLRKRKRSDDLVACSSYLKPSLTGGDAPIRAGCPFERLRLFLVVQFNELQTRLINPPDGIARHRTRASKIQRDSCVLKLPLGSAAASETRAATVPETRGNPRTCRHAKANGL